MSKRITLGKPLGGFLAGAGLDELALAGGHVFWVNPGAGSDTDSFFNSKSPDKPFLTTAEGYANTTDGNNDVVCFIAQATKDTPAATLAWSNNYTHLIGVGGGLVQTAGRARINYEAAAGPAQLVTFSGNGCVVKNMQFFNGPVLGTASGAVVVSGDRNKFVNSHFAGMGDVTSSAVAGSYSLTVTGSENEFIDCTIGLDTILRGASNVAQLILGATGKRATRNVFKRCRIVSASETTGAFMASIVEADRYTIFDDCVFYNFSVNEAVNLVDCFTDAETRTHDIIISGKSRLVGITGWGTAAAITHMWIENVAGAGTSGIELQPTA
jgi:hypothetical protein